MELLGDHSLNIENLFMSGWGWYEQENRKSRKRASSLLNDVKIFYDDITSAKTMEFQASQGER